MPSDCQCSAYVVKERVVLNNKKATQLIQKLENEIDVLKEENQHLKRRLRKARINKEKIIEELKTQLDKI